jgi:hypothetical protein
MMADPLLAQSAIDRLQSAAFELVIEGEAYRQGQNPHPHHPELTPSPSTRHDHHHGPRPGQTGP